MNGALQQSNWLQFIRLDDQTLMAQCAVDCFRASGPGGQKRNKTDSAVRLRHQPTSVTVEAAESRSQHENRVRALRRLRLAIALEVRAPVRKNGDLPKELSEVLQTTQGRTISVGQRDVRYPATIAAIFDVLSAKDWRIAPTARQLGVSVSQLTRFLENDRIVWRAVQSKRQVLGLRPLTVRR